MAMVNIEGHGAFTLNAEQTQALMSWMQQNGIAKTVNNEGSNYDGNSLLNETENKNKKPPRSGPEGDTYNFGGTWL